MLRVAMQVGMCMLGCCETLLTHPDVHRKVACNKNDQLVDVVAQSAASPTAAGEGATLRAGHACQHA